MARKPLAKGGMIDSPDDFAEVYKDQAPLIYRFMFWRTRDAMLAEDLTSHVFEKAWRKRGSYHGGSVRAWLHMIARNTLIDHWRRVSNVPLDDSLEANLASDQTAPAEVIDGELEAKRLRRAVWKLPAPMRAVVELRFIEGLSGRQTAFRLGLSEANARVIQYRALRKLKELLDEYTAIGSGTASRWRQPGRGQPAGTVGRAPGMAEAPAAPSGGVVASGQAGGLGSGWRGAQPGSSDNGANGPADQLAVPRAAL